MKKLLHTMVATLALACVPGLASANGAAASYPDKTVRLIVPFETGGTVNLIGRILAQHLTQELGQSVIVENKPGAGGTLGADLVAKSPADGYTLLLASSAHQSFHPQLYKRLPYDANKAFTQVALFATVPNVLVVSNKLPVKNVAELIEYSKRAKQPPFMGSAGNGSVNHLIGEMFQSRTGAKLEHVPYKGAGPAGMDLIAGQIDVLFANLPNVLPHIKNGKVRVLAVAGDKRNPALPDVPTMAEAGVKDFVVDSWSGVLAPAGTPKEIIDKLAVAITKAAKDPATAKSLALQGAEPMPGAQVDYAKLVQFEATRWTDVIQRGNISLQ